MMFAGGKRKEWYKLYPDVVYIFVKWQMVIRWYSSIRGVGATVAHPTPDRGVGSSNLSRLTCLFAGL